MDEDEIRVGSVDYVDKGGCLVIEKKSGLSRPCQFPFIYLNRTFNGCTTIINIDEDTGEYVHGEPWCSTRTNRSNHHIPRRGFFGDCVAKDCPKADEGTIKMIA